MKLNKERGKVLKLDNLITSGQIYSLFIDYLLVIPHPCVLFLGFKKNKLF